ncbi:MAG TPA: hypothetical protein PLK24_10360 [Atribacter sp.]|jgi:hypothetical protein|uniref:Uncharacterized protein n=1 Tax=Candidatus Atribacter allofermentans TaxID=1852833 RepID=A0A1V5SS84_9BACT|nr:hypothetical protein [Atribacter sp.]MDD3715258.1 hypothetical protein [Atribacterota bacterium]OQA56852.1 MAG: hypothetical protein BWY41_01435 [Candidatus Atribacteria bacterium ADurb.Bin276]HHT10167.1 hypothetical protein [Candidatus Atribacteria bacterium]MDI9594036.1 hypothetical protein [Atribacterota bacterium]HQK84329.1 hypothetical protein [Atribacter sp.]
MSKEKENMREMFEEMFFTPLNSFFGPQVSEEVRSHLSQARIEILKAMKTFIESEIDKLEKTVHDK